MGRRIAAVEFCLACMVGLVALAARTWTPTQSTTLQPARSQPRQQFEYTRTLWRISDGLPEDTVQAMVDSSKGVLWIGTTGGLSRFDGSHMEVPPQLQALRSNSIFALTFARDGSLWAGTEGGGLLRVRNGMVAVYSTHEGLTDGFVRKVFEDRRGRLWVGTDDGLFVREGDRLRRVDQGEIAPIAVHSIADDLGRRIEAHRAGLGWR